MAITLLLADDHQAYRERLRALLEQEPDLSVVGEAEDGQAVVQLVRSTAPHLVLMDVVLPKLNGVEATRQIVSATPGVKVLALSLYAERQWVEAMVQAGASGYMLKDDDLAELLRAIRAVAAGQTYFSPALGIPRPGGGPPGDPQPNP